MTKLQQIGEYALKLAKAEKSLKNLKAAPRSINSGMANMYMNNAIENVRIANFNLNLLF